MKTILARGIKVGDYVKVLATTARAGTQGKVLKASRVNLEIEAPYFDTTVVVKIEREAVAYLVRDGVLYSMKKEARDGTDGT